MKLDSFQQLHRRVCEDGLIVNGEYGRVASAELSRLENRINWGGQGVALAMVYDAASLWSAMAFSWRNACTVALVPSHLPVPPPPVDRTSTVGPALLLLSGGSSGEPRWLRLTWAALSRNVGSLDLVPRAETRGGNLSTLAAHTVGSVVVLLRAVAGGERVCFAPGRDRFLSTELWRSFRPTVLATTPWDLRTLDRRLQENSDLDVRFGALEVVGVGGGSTPLKTRERVVARLPTALALDSYGCTELGGAVLSGELGTGSQRALPGVEYRLGSLDQSSRLVPGGMEVGLHELVVRVPEPAQRYEDGRGWVSVADADSFYRTGDVV